MSTKIISQNLNEIVSNLKAMHAHQYCLLPGSVAITLEQNQHKGKEEDSGHEKRALKVEIKELELAHQETVKSLKKVRKSLIIIYINELLRNMIWPLLT